MSGIIFDHKPKSYQEEITSLKRKITEYETTIRIQSQHIAKLNDFIDETNKLMKKEVGIVRGEL